MSKLKVRRVRPINIKNIILHILHVISILHPIIKNVCYLECDDESRIHINLSLVVRNVIFIDRNFLCLEGFQIRQMDALYIDCHESAIANKHRGFVIL